MSYDVSSSKACKAARVPWELLQGTAPGSRLSGPGIVEHIGQKAGLLKWLRQAGLPLPSTAAHGRARRIHEDRMRSSAVLGCLILGQALL